MCPSVSPCEAQGQSMRWHHSTLGHYPALLGKGEKNENKLTTMETPIFVTNMKESLVYIKLVTVVHTPRCHQALSETAVHNLAQL